MAIPAGFDDANIKAESFNVRKFIRRKLVKNPAAQPTETDALGLTKLRGIWQGRGSAYNFVQFQGEPSFNDDDMPLILVSMGQDVQEGLTVDTRLKERTFDMTIEYYTNVDSDGVLFKESRREPLLTELEDTANIIDYRVNLGDVERARGAMIIQLNDIEYKISSDGSHDSLVGIATLTYGVNYSLTY